jgi:hypothetical protein
MGRTYRNVLGFWWKRARTAIVAIRAREYELIENAQRYSERIARDSSPASRMIRTRWRMRRPLYVITRVCTARSAHTFDLHKRVGRTRILAEQQLKLLRATFSDSEPDSDSDSGSEEVAPELVDAGITLQDAYRDKLQNSRDCMITYAFSAEEVFPERSGWTRALHGLRLWGKKTELTLA